MIKLKVWIKAVRAPFFQAAIIPTLVGAIVAWHKGFFNLGLLILSVIGMACVNGGTNLINDYYDHLSRGDDINVAITPFSGGSRVIQEGTLSPKAVLRGGLILLTLAFIIGLYLSVVRGLAVIIIGTIGILIGYFYTAEPIKLGYRGVGEFFVGFTLGPLAVLGSYYVQTQRFDFEPFWASLPIGLLIAGILYINEFPDYEADKAVGKNHLIVLLGPQRAVKGYYLILILVYLTIICGVGLGILPEFTLITLLTIPWAIKAVSVTRAYYLEYEKLIPAMVLTILLHLTVGFLLVSGYLLDKLF